MVLLRAALIVQQDRGVLGRRSIRPIRHFDGGKVAILRARSAECRLGTQSAAPRFILSDDFQSQPILPALAGSRLATLTYFLAAAQPRGSASP